MMQHVMKAENAILLPIIAIVLWMMIGNAARVLIPFICAISSMLLTWMVIFLIINLTALNVVNLVPFFVVCSSFALGIDYGLFLLTRFREELAAGQSLEVCLARMLYYSGHVTCLSGAVLLVICSGYFFFQDANELQIASFALGVCLSI